ncbi:MAG TPA: hypothetical protein VF615_19830 [Longimicrobiaceae bacterium]|jgi:hypothetical protein
MPRLLPLLLLLLLQPRAAEAELLAYGYMAYVAPVAAAPPPPQQHLLPADAAEPRGSIRCPGDRTDRAPQETAPRSAPRLRAPWASLVARAPAGCHAIACSPLCERLPYDATAPPAS